jgi:arylsulfatase A-like enzyme
VRAHARTADDQPGEGDDKGFGVVFPHALAASKDPGHAFRASPFSDEVLFALALAAIDGEKVGAHDALIALSLSANDYIGHLFGPDSWEAWDELAQLDRALGRFLGELDARLGSDGYAVMLTADHGVTTMPEAALVPGVRRWCQQGLHDRWERACGPVGRIFGDALVSELREASVRALGPSDWVLGVADPYVYLTPAGRALDVPRRALLDRAVTSALTAHSEVEQVIPTRTLPSQCPPETDESLLALVCRSAGEGAGDYYVVPRRGSFFDPGIGKGTSHGSPYLFDRAVPLLVRAPGSVAAGPVVEQAVGFETFFWTTVALLGMDAMGHRPPWVFPSPMPP